MMKVRRIELTNYRNYRSQVLEAAPGVSVFIGQNAQGKTNILEAVYYAALGRSHRTSADSDLIRWEEESARICIDFTRREAENQLKFNFFRNKRRQMLRNGIAIRMKDLIGTINAVLFSPEDLFLIKGAPAGRRRFLDMEISQVDPAYFYDLAIYTRLLNQRNTLLKRIRDREAREEELSLWDVQLVPKAVSVMEKRIAAVRKLEEFAFRTQKEISGGGEELSLRYEIHGMEEGAGLPMTNDLHSWYNKKMAESLKLDILRGVTRFGPHRDDLAFFVNGVDLRSFGSQGQQRTGVLALKLAELAFFKDETGEYPILLLDDVMSELDRTRREQLLSFIRGESLQAMITATDEAYFPEGGFGTVFRVEHGTVTAE